MDKLFPIKGHSNLARTLDGAVVNTDKSAFRKARAAKRYREEQASRINILEQQVQELTQMIKNKQV